MLVWLICQHNTAFTPPSWVCLSIGSLLPPRTSLLVYVYPFNSECLANFPKPVAVMSTLVGNIVTKAKKSHPDIEGHVIASCLAVISGAIIVTIGLLRLGRIVDLIPLVSISAFMTGSALNIATGQLPGLMGITGFSSRDASYKVLIHTLQGLPRTTLDAAMGLTALAMLYLIRSACKFAAKRYPKHQKAIFFISTLRTAFVILLYTMISWLANRHHRKHHLFKILGTVPRGKHSLLRIY